MAKTNKANRRSKIPPAEINQELRVIVDEAGEPVISDDDPDIIPSPEEELEAMPPYEPPPPAEGP
ncbi:hypothetical protein [Agriterribacter sp.]|uniref:hypothetical protein n=1 Tax=Agriterribacter sp. TaxID=2821509 RepID=UPI002BCFA9C6|nr:hypothetical protein [Agriterribacter sp.]HRO47536.1 hypothetical protein [Agriterribacter sp.]HRQ17006.1 hypothetical protein [Agriterribacter sp.]